MNAEDKPIQKNQIMTTKGKTQSLMSAGGGGVKSPMSAGGGEASPPKSRVRTPQEKINLLLVYKKHGKDKSDSSLSKFTEKELSEMIDNSPKKVTAREKEELIQKIKNPEQPTPTPSSKTPTSAKQALEYYGGLPIILSDFSENIKQVQDIYEVISKSPGEKVTVDQIRTINKFMPPDRRIRAHAGYERVAKALKELKERFIEESKFQKIEQLPGESASIVTPMQTPQTGRRMTYPNKSGKSPFKNKPL